jgi:hypothetical protein
MVTTCRDYIHATFTTGLNLSCGFRFWRQMVSPQAELINAVIKREHSYSRAYVALIYLLLNQASVPDFPGLHVDGIVLGKEFLLIGVRVEEV